MEDHWFHMWFHNPCSSHIFLLVFKKRNSQRLNANLKGSKHDFKKRWHPGNRVHLLNHLCLQLGKAPGDLFCFSPFTGIRFLKHHHIMHDDSIIWGYTAWFKFNLFWLLRKCYECGVICWSQKTIACIQTLHYRKERNASNLLYL